MNDKQGKASNFLQLSRKIMDTPYYRDKPFNRLDSFDSSRNHQAYDSAKQYANSFDDIRQMEKNSMIFFGSTGTGKTHLAAAIANCIINEKHHPVMFGTFIEYLDRIRSEFSDNTEHAKQEMKSLPLLVIDDLGKEKQTAWSDQTLFEIINYRYEHKANAQVPS